MGVPPLPPHAARDSFGAGALVLALLLTAGAHAQTSSSERKSMEFGVVPSEPRQPPPPRPDSAAGTPAGAASTPAPPSVAPQPAPLGMTPPPNAQSGQPALEPSTPPSPAQGTTAQAQSPALPSVQAGLLECRGEFATGYGFGSTRKVTCEFRPTVGVVHYYVGTLERVGLDIGISDQASLLWGVLATSRDLKPGALAGRYVGVTSGFALGPGFSANMLASQDATRQITLQPVSVSSDSGLSLSIAGATLTLEPSATRPH